MTMRSPLPIDGFLALPETKPASEYACGEVFEKPMPTQSQSFLQTYLAAILFTSNIGIRAQHESTAMEGA